MKEISNQKGLSILTKVIPPLIFASISALVKVNPSWTVLFLTSMGIINAWGDFGQARVNEFVKYLEEHKNEFKDGVIESDKFKSVFVNVLERHVKEVSEQKRELLRKYLLAVGSGKGQNFDNHTKILFALDQITPEEFLVIMNLPHVKESMENEMKDLGSEEYQFEGASTTQVQIWLKELGRHFSESAIAEYLMGLRNYGLVTLQEQTHSTLGSGSYSLYLSRITETGWQFIEFLK